MNREELERLDDAGMAAWSDHDANAFMDLFADGFVWTDWTMPEPIKTREEGIAYFKAWMTAFPDMQVKTTNRVIGEDAVASEVSWSGTNTGPMSMGGMEIPATNKTAMGRGAYIARAKDGKIVEFNTFPDAAGVMMQLGLMPEM
jgi:steroid delta-isomerase-like uncharacterized protein